jgi:peptidoglycan/xylan/chitin deacetylase (PgdA/CDA1 family)
MPAVRRYVKGLAGVALLRSGLYGKFVGEEGTIIAFHRIDDRYPDDPITTTEGDFRALCDLFRGHFDVVGLPELLDALAAAQSLEGKLAITFDDGYLDNHRVAAPYLDKLGLPATFFISTGFVGTDRVPWWDRQAGIASRWMTWGDVEELHRGGFGLGDHTVNHVDMGIASADEARVELEESRAALEEVTGGPVDLFAFPFGRAHQLSEENRALVRELGFRCALSCHGGRVSPGEDPFRLRRVPISPWYRGAGQFAFELLRP